MTTPDDGERDDPANKTPDGQGEPELPFDEEAAWRSIMENYGERAHLGPLAVDPTPPDPPPAPPWPPRPSPPRPPLRGSGRSSTGPTWMRTTGPLSPTTGATGPTTGR